MDCTKQPICDTLTGPIMPSNTVVELGFVRLDGRRRAPLFRQLYDSIRAAILDGRLTANSRIPSSRDLVKQLGVSRTTVVTAIDQLIAEGYLQTAVGSGTFVSREIPTDRPFLREVPEPEAGQLRPANSTQLSSRGQVFAGKTIAPAPFSGPIKAFRPGVPALDQFPVAIWSQLVRRMWKQLTPRDLSYGPPAGYFPLRQELAKYLSAHRGVRCTAEQVILTGGTQAAIDLVARLCLDTGDEVLFENPGYTSARHCFLGQGARIAPMKIDANGLAFAAAKDAFPNARLAYVTPSHQYPLGHTLPIEKRMELIRWAANGNRWIVEDDYDSEYRYGQKPIPAMQGMDSAGRTLYVGSLSKVAFPALGLGYLIVPAGLASAFEAALATSTRPTSMVDQFVLHEFIREGHFARHLRRMRKTHAERHDVFVSEMERHLPDVFTILGTGAGLHCAAQLRNRRNDTAVASQLAEIGIITRPLSGYYHSSTPKRDRISGLVFGFAPATPGQIRYAVRRMAEVL